MTQEQLDHRAWYMRKWRAEHRDRAREISRKGSAKYASTWRDLWREQKIRHNAKIRAYIISFFGGKCVRCGFNDSRALQLDHINGHGNVERKTKKLDSLSQRYRFVKNHPKEARKKYQLLCANCNCIKRVENYEYRYARPGKDE